MPTGSKDPDVLLAWLLDSMGLVRSRTEGATIDEEQGAIHRMVRHTLLEEPLKGWDNSAISEFSDSPKLEYTIRCTNYGKLA